MKLAHLKQFAASAAFTLSIVFSLGMGMPVTALSASPMSGMSHEGTSVTSCANQHNVAPGVTEKVSTDKLKAMNDEPTPTPLPYFVQFQQTYMEQRKITPTDIVCLASYHPPDIVRLTSNLRF